MHQIWSQLPNFMQVKAFVHAKPFYVMTFFYILSLKLFQYLRFRVGVWVCMSSFMSVRKKQRCLFLQVASAVHKETSELSWVDIISSHVLSLLATPSPTPPPAEMSGEMKAADRQRSSSDDVQHSRRTSCGEKLDVNAVFFLLLAQLFVSGVGQQPPQSCPPPTTTLFMLRPTRPAHFGAKHAHIARNRQ